MQLQWPLYNIDKHPSIRVSQWFGEKALDYTSKYGWLGHNGIDIAAPKGTPIYAVHDGYIIEALGGQETEGYGVRVSQYWEDDDKEWLAVYGHLVDYNPLPRIPYNYFNRSHFVHKGDIIGHVDSTGFSSGNHLHFGLYNYKVGVKLNSNNGYGGALDAKSYLPTKFPEEGNIDMITVEKVNGTVYLNFNDKFSIGIASDSFAKKLADADIPTVDKPSIPTQEYTLTSDAFIIHKK